MGPLSMRYAATSAWLRAGRGRSRGWGPAAPGGRFPGAFRPDL